MDRLKGPDSLPARDGEAEKQEDRSWHARYLTEIRSLLPFFNNGKAAEIPKKRKVYYYTAFAMLVLAIIAIALGLGLSAHAKQIRSEHDNIVFLDYAAYNGYKQDNGVSYWKGMRFAAPPTGSLRFAAPQDPQIQFGIQDATEVNTFRYQ